MMDLTCTLCPNPIKPGEPFVSHLSVDAGGNTNGHGAVHLSHIGRS